MDTDNSTLDDILSDFENEHDVIATAARREIARLQAIEKAADKYWNSSSFIANSDGDCISCGSDADDPAQHAEHCPHRVSGVALRALLDHQP
jgi:hypothetical protein